jgi:hypothetical protein
MGIALRSGAAGVTYWGLRLNPYWHSARRDTYHFIDTKLARHLTKNDVTNLKRQESFLDLLRARYPTGLPEGVSIPGLRDELLTYIMCVVSYLLVSLLT